MLFQIGNQYLSSKVLIPKKTCCSTGFLMEFKDLIGIMEAYEKTCRETYLLIPQIQTVVEMAGNRYCGQSSQE